MDFYVATSNRSVLSDDSKIFNLHALSRVGNLDTIIDNFNVLGDNLNKIKVTIL